LKIPAFQLSRLVEAMNDDAERLALVPLGVEAGLRPSRSNGRRGSGRGLLIARRSKVVSGSTSVGSDGANPRALQPAGSRDLPSGHEGSHPSHARNRPAPSWWRTVSCVSVAEREGFLRCSPLRGSAPRNRRNGSGEVIAVARLNALCRRT
jgi:hypothetical protein